MILYHSNQCEVLKVTKTVQLIPRGGRNNGDIPATVYLHTDAKQLFNNLFKVCLFFFFCLWVLFCFFFWQFEILSFCALVSVGLIGRNTHKYANRCKALLQYFTYFELEIILNLRIIPKQHFQKLLLGYSFMIKLYLKIRIIKEYTH